MKRRSIIIVLAACLAASVLVGCQEQPPAQPMGGATRPEASATNAPAPSMSGETQPQAPGSSQPAPSTSGENQPAATDTNQPPTGGPAQ